MHAENDNRNFGQIPRFHARVYPESCGLSRRRVGEDVSRLIGSTGRTRKVARGGTRRLEILQMVLLKRASSTENGNRPPSGAVWQTCANQGQSSCKFRLETPVGTTSIILKYESQPPWSWRNILPHRLNYTGVAHPMVEVRNGPRGI